MSDDKKLESLYASLPGELRSPGVILAVIEVLLALKKLYDLLHKNERAKLFADAPTNEIHWEVVNDSTAPTDPKDEESAW